MFTRFVIRRSLPPRVYPFGHPLSRKLNVDRACCPVGSCVLGLLRCPTETCALRSTQPLKVNTRDFSRGKGGRCVWLTTYHPCSAERRENPGP